MPPRSRIGSLLAASAVALCAALLVPAHAHAQWVWPLHGDVITPYRNGSDPYAAGQHRGIDIAGDAGTPVIAAVGGTVRFAGTAGSSGLTVSIRTGDGRFDTSYLHLSSTAVRPSQRVEAGEPLGAVGTTGVRSAAPPHLHFGVRDAGSRHGYHDPLTFLPPLPRPRESPRETPRGSPAPTPIPVLPAPRPEPVRTPASRRAPVRRRVPAARRIPAGHPEPARPRVPAGRPVPVRSRRPTGGRDRVRRTRPGTPRAPAPAAPDQAAGRTSVSSAGPLPGGAAHVIPGTQAAAPPSAGRPAAGGLDVGWALACAGLLLAAGLLGLSEGGRKATRRGRERLGGLLRPVSGPR